MREAVGELLRYFELPSRPPVHCDAQSDNHFDPKDRTYQIGLAWGSRKQRLCLDERTAGGRVEKIDCHDKLKRLDGRFQHWHEAPAYTANGRIVGRTRWSAFFYIADGPLHAARKIRDIPRA